MNDFQIPTLHPSDQLLIDSSIDRARFHLDRLARCRNLDEVESAFGSARHLAELLFGFPVNGGLANRPVIRTLGALLKHPLGPAVAVEILGLLVEVQDLTSAELLAAALEAHRRVTSAVGEPPPLVIEAARRRVVREPLNLVKILHDLTRPDRPSGHCEGDCRGIDPCEAPHPWIRASGDSSPLAFMRSLYPSFFDDEESLSNPVWLENNGHRQGQFRKTRRSTSREGVCEELLRFAEDGSTELAELSINRNELLQLIRVPYDPATLHLAIRHGDYDQARVRRMLIESTKPNLLWMFEESRPYLLTALVRLELLDAPELGWIVSSVTDLSWRRLIATRRDNEDMARVLQLPNIPVALVVAALLEFNPDDAPSAVVGKQVVERLAVHPDERVRLAVVPHLGSCRDRTSFVEGIERCADIQLLRSAARSGDPVIVASSLTSLHQLGVSMTPVACGCPPEDVIPFLTIRPEKLGESWLPFSPNVAAIAHTPLRRRWGLSEETDDQIPLELGIAEGDPFGGPVAMRLWVG